MLTFLIVYSIYFSQRYSREWSFLTKDLLSHMCVKIHSAPTNSTEKIIFFNRPDGETQIALVFLNLSYECFINEPNSKTLGKSSHTSNTKDKTRKHQNCNYCLCF